MKMIKKGNKIKCINEVPIQLKKDIGKVLNRLIKDYRIKGKDIEAFKHILKANIMDYIDNHYHCDVRK